MNNDLAPTQYGFRWGPFEVERTFSDDRVGFLIRVLTDYQECQIAVSPQGRRIRTSTRKRSKGERATAKAGSEHS